MSENVLSRDLKGYWIISGIGVIIWNLSILAPFLLHIIAYVLAYFFYLVGNILLLVGLYGVSTKLNVNIFKIVLIASIINAVAILITDLLFSASISVTQSADLISSVFILLIYLAISSVAVITSSYLFKKAFNKIAKSTNHNLFNTAGSLIFWGSILCLVIIGILIYFIGWIILAVAFFTAPSEMDVLDNSETGSI